MGNESSSPARLHFKVIADKNEALSSLVNAEKIDMYVEECHDDRANSIARHNLTYTPNSISLRDYNYATSYLESIINSIPKRLVLELEEVKIIHLMPSADGGMPHTRPGDIICYPNISQIFSKVTLIHELWHIHQRKYREVWFKAFQKMGWNVWNGQLPEQIEKNRRYNPDTIDYPLWIFDGKWVPVPIFRDISKPNVGDVEIWFYNPQKQYHSKTVPGEISGYYPDLPHSAYEHPRELSAYMLSEPDKYLNSKGFKDLIEQIGQISITP